ncbi:MAG: efflux RND transporter periplasmic adaptor subunit [Proteobacteria bacterium]|nr:efflux RND transporter periplasmic adaptor subunit [Pseudomonadota bacterium]
MSSSRRMLAAIVPGALALIAVGAAAGYWLAQRGSAALHAQSVAIATTTPITGTPQATATAAAAGNPSTGPRHDKPLYWYDPMQPTQHFDKPGKSPYMDMQLLPRYADAEAAGGVRVSPDTVQNLGIRTGIAVRMTMPVRLRAVGAVAFDERLLELVQARVDGSIAELHVKAPFERVRRGQPLAEVLAPQWLETEQQYAGLLNADPQSPAALRAAARERLRVLGVPEAVIRRIESTRRAAATTTTVYAPTDGVVTELPVRQGAAFLAGAGLFRINGLKSVWVNARIPEAQVSEVNRSSSVKVHVTAWPGVTFRGRVLAVLPDVDRETRTLTARVAVDNAGYRLSPGMYVTLDFASATGAPQLTVPSEAIIATGTRTVVIVARQGGGFDVAEVTVGREQDGRTTILSGLQEGQRIVLSGQFLIDSEASLTAAVERLTGPAARPGADKASARRGATP